MMANDLIRWVLTDGRRLALGEDPEHEAGSPARFIDALCSRLMVAGVPLWHVTLYAATLHPQINGFGWRWWRERNSEEVGATQAEELLRGPMRNAMEHGTVRRCRLEGANSGFPLLENLRAAGGTEYLSVPLNHIGGRYPAIAWATDRAGGFTNSELALLEEIRPALAAVVEALMTVRTARGLFLTYHGRHVSDRVIDGQIRRGHVEPLRAVIMAIDLRGFTGFSDRLPAAKVIALLNHYFEVVSSTVHAHGGTVLKFIGDGVLAIFGTDGAPDQRAARAALKSARKIVAELPAHKSTARDCAPASVFTSERSCMAMSARWIGWTFTVIGPAVNLAFRLESLTKKLGVPVLTSHAFARAAGAPLASLGPHPIRGLRGLEEVFGMPRTALRSPRARRALPATDVSHDIST